MAGLHLYDNRLGPNEDYLKRSLAIRETALGPNHPDVATSLNDLALWYSRGRSAEAESLYKRSLAIWETIGGSDHREVAVALNNLALLYKSQRRFAEAEALYVRSLAIAEKAVGENPGIVVYLANLAELYLAQGNWARAADCWRRSTELLTRRARAIGADEALNTEMHRPNTDFLGLIKMTHRLAAEGRAPESPAKDMFEMAQWAQTSQAAAALAQMAARSATGSATLSNLVRERQDLVHDAQIKGRDLILHKSKEPAKRNTEVEKALTDQLAAIEARLGEINGRLTNDFPDHAALANQTPTSLVEVQEQLAADEALVLLLDSLAWESLPEETFIWIVTKSEVRWVRSELGRNALTREVKALRCGLDSAAWEDNYLPTCAEVAATASIASQLIFDTARAHRLYASLFGEVEDLIRGKHLLIVSEGPLTQLPFQVLVTASPPNSDYRSAAWLVRKHAITVLPAVSSLKALRGLAKASSASKPMIGVGNPLLDGNPAERPGEARLATLARTKQLCQQGTRLAEMLEKRRNVGNVVMPGGSPDLDLLRLQAPLPETADELCFVAEELRTAPDDILLGARAAEASIKRLSSEGRLAAYRVVHFATHGVMPGELDANSQPGLILTPPSEQTELDDGYLSALEISSLKLDADWVILSACNTAAGGLYNAEALSGLARAFFYAGVRALLVSHWAVNSAATVKLVTAAVGATARDKKLGRAEALRRAMLAMIDNGQPNEAHPSYWSPFVVVGEGAAAK